MSITAIVAVLNEERNLAECLSALRFCDLIVVLDSNSVDRTASIAAHYGAQVVQFPGVTAADGQRKRTWYINSGKVDTDWTLVIDADEVVPPDLAAEILSAASRRDGPEGYLIRYDIHYLGKVLRHASMDEAKQLRFFRTGRGAYDDLDIAWSPEMGDVEVHERIQVNGEVGEFSTALIHDDFRGYANWLAKHNRYSTWEAEARSMHSARSMTNLQSVRLLFSSDALEQRRALRHLSTYAVARPTLVFLWFFFVKSGWRDGYRGFLFCRARQNYEFDICVKEYEQKTASTHIEER